MKKIESVEEFNQLIENESKPICVDFYAEWCGPCKMVMPVLEQVSNDKEDELVVVKIDADQLPEILEKYGVRGVPTLMMFKAGSVVGMKSGAMMRSQIVELVESA